MVFGKPGHYYAASAQAVAEYEEMLGLSFILNAIFVKQFFEENQ